jgi:hypothetical protein
MVIVRGNIMLAMNLNQRVSFYNDVNYMLDTYGGNELSVFEDLIYVKVIYGEFTEIAANALSFNEYKEWQLLRGNV